MESTASSSGRFGAHDARRRPVVYLIGSLRTERIPHFANLLEAATGYEVFDSWYAAGPNADDCLRDYENLRGRSIVEALRGHAATHVYEFDKSHIDRADASVLLMPAGKSAHTELGYTVGTGKPGFICFDEQAPERLDVMWNFATDIAWTLDELVPMLKRRLG